MHKITVCGLVLLLGGSLSLQGQNAENRGLTLSQWDDELNQRSQAGQARNWELRLQDEIMQRSTPYGRSPDYSIYLREARNMAAHKKALAITEVPNSMGSNSGWVPTGPWSWPDRGEAWQYAMGRFNCVAFHPTDSNIFWVGVAQGGIWKTSNGGKTWASLGEDLPILRISDIAVNPLNPDEIYICLGDMAYIGVSVESEDRKRHTHYGLGVYKTLDGGFNWNPTGLTFEQVGADNSLLRRVIIDPNNPQRLVAAGPGGIWNSDNAGTTWNKVLDSLILDIEPNPLNGNTLFATGGFLKTLNKGSAGILRSTDFGRTWTWISSNIPKINAVQRIEIEVSPADTTRVYAIACDLERGFYGFFRSEDAGLNWTGPLGTGGPNILHWQNSNAKGGQGLYDLILLPHPTQKNTVFAGGVNIWGSTDGGNSWEGLSYFRAQYGLSVHADQHQFKYNPLSKSFFLCNDGGLYRTHNPIIHPWNKAENGEDWPTKWEYLSGNMQVTSYYRISARNLENGLELVAGAQDNGTTYSRNGKWKFVTGGDGMDCAMHPMDTGIIYTSSQYGTIYSSHMGPDYLYWDSAPEEGEWVTPMEMDPDGKNGLYALYRNLYLSAYPSSFWQKLGNIPAHPVLGYNTVGTALSVPPDGPKQIYVAFKPYHPAGAHGRVFFTLNQGMNWSEHSAGLPTHLYITGLQAHPKQNGPAWVCFSGFEAGKKVYYKANPMAAWENITRNLPNVPVNDLALHYGTPHNTLYAATDLGVYYTNDTLDSWVLYSQNLPNVIVSDIDILTHRGEMFISTFGRGTWMNNTVDPPTNTLVDGPVQNWAVHLSSNPMDPYHGGFYLQYPNANAGHPLPYKVINVMGQTVSQGNVRSEFTPLGPLDHEGMYFLEIGAARERQVLRFWTSGPRN